MSYGTSQRTSGDAKKARPGRTLFVTLLLTAILGGVALSLGATSINLGLDLRAVLASPCNHEFKMETLAR